MTSLHASLTGFRTSLSRSLRVQATKLGQTRSAFTATRRDKVSYLEPGRLPRILQPELWKNVVPESLRANAKEAFRSSRNRSYNPATYFIWIYILIGSQAMRIIGVKNDHQDFVRKADVQIDKLREVIRKLQAGEEVDVEKILGTGIPEEEEAWDQALREIENEERLWQANKNEKRRQREALASQQAEEAAEKQDASPVRREPTSPKMTADIPSATQTVTAPGFY